jgi:tryptophan synthase alpha chain
MSLITDAFNDGPVLIPYITAGDPSEESTEKYVSALVKGGAKIIELGLPFSEPIADGPIIQEAIERSLRAGMNPKKFFELVSRIDREIPLVVMTYYNIVYQYGEIQLESFVAKSVECGINGIIVPDLPVEEAEELLDVCNKYGIDLIFIIAPTTQERRVEKIMENISGFVYVQARLGITGIQTDVSQTTHESLKKLEKYNIPKAVGFGVSNGNQAREIVRGGADGIIAGSVFVNIISNANSKNNAMNDNEIMQLLEDKARELSKGIES